MSESAARDVLFQLKGEVDQSLTKSFSALETYIKSARGELAGLSAEMKGLGPNPWSGGIGAARSPGGGATASTAQAIQDQAVMRGATAAIVDDQSRQQALAVADLQSKLGPSYQQVFNGIPGRGTNVTPYAPALPPAHLSMADRTGPSYRDTIAASSPHRSYAGMSPEQVVASIVSESKSGISAGAAASGAKRSYAGMSAEQVTQDIINEAKGASFGNAEILRAKGDHASARNDLAKHIKDQRNLDREVALDPAKYASQQLRESRRLAYGVATGEIGHDEAKERAGKLGERQGALDRVGAAKKAEHDEAEKKQDKLIEQQHKLREGFYETGRGAIELSRAIGMASLIGETDLGKITNRLLEMNALLGATGIKGVVSGLHNAGVFDRGGLLAQHLPGAYTYGRAAAIQAGRFGLRAGGALLGGGEMVSGALGLGGVGAGALGLAGAGVAAVAGVGAAGYSAYHAMYDEQHTGRDGRSFYKPDTFTYKAASKAADWLASISRHLPGSYEHQLKYDWTGYNTDFIHQAQAEDRLGKTRKAQEHFAGARPEIDEYIQNAREQSESRKEEFARQLSTQQRIASLRSPEEHGIYGEDLLISKGRDLRNQIGGIDAQRGVVSGALTETRRQRRDVEGGLADREGGQIAKSGEGNKSENFWKGNVESAKEMGAYREKLISLGQQELQQNRELGRLDVERLGLSRQAVALEQQRHERASQNLHSAADLAGSQARSLEAKQQDFHVQIAADPSLRAQVSRYQAHGANMSLREKVRLQERLGKGTLQSLDEDVQRHADKEFKSLGIHDELGDRKNEKRRDQKRFQTGELGENEAAEAASDKANAIGTKIRGTTADQLEADEKGRLDLAAKTSELSSVMHEISDLLKRVIANRGQPAPQPPQLGAFAPRPGVGNSTPPGVDAIMMASQRRAAVGNIG